MGEVIKFPKREDRDEPMTCGGVIHVFDEVPGRCHCGQEFWTPEGELAPPTDEIGVHEVRTEVTG